MEKLKPCPLCGGKPKEKIAIVANGFVFDISCDSCSFGITKKPYIYPGENYITPEELNNQLKELEDRWNKRIHKCPFDHDC